MPSRFESSMIKRRLPLLALVLALLGAFFNWFIRGGGIESALLNNRNVAGLRIVNALAYGGVSWWLSGSWVTAAFAFIGMFIGSTLALGAYIRAMKGDDPDHSEGWGVWRMALRGGAWGVCIAAGMGLSVWAGGSVTRPVEAALWLILGGLAQGPIVYGVIKFYGLKIIKENKWFNSWTVGEIIHGAVMWLPLLLLAMKKRRPEDRRFDNDNKAPD